MEGAYHEIAGQAGVLGSAGVRALGVEEGIAERRDVPQRLDDHVQKAVVAAGQVDEAFVCQAALHAGWIRRNGREQLDSYEQWAISDAR